MPNLELYSVRDGAVPTQSGLNWGFADAHVNVEDAYIALTIHFFRQYPDFFPPHGETINVQWDDGVRMCCLLEGTQQINGDIYPKQISSYDDKSVLGHYLRGRLGVEPTHLITMQDLINYGRDHVTVRSLGNNNYFFDFS